MRYAADSRGSKVQNQLIRIENIPSTNRAVGSSKKLPGAISCDRRKSVGQPTGMWAAISPGAPLADRNEGLQQLLSTPLTPLALAQPAAFERALSPIPRPW